MNEPVRVLLLGAWLSLAACQCQPDTVSTCDSARCPGTCRNGVCMLATGGGAPSSGGSAAGGAAGGLVSGGSAGGVVMAGGDAAGGGSAGGVSTAGGTSGGQVAAGGRATAGGMSAGGSTSGGSSGTAGGSAGGTFFVDFDGGWQIQVPPPNPALNGNNSTTVHLGTGADATSSTKFGGPSGTAPSVVYPPDGVLFPPNTNRIEFHFLPGAGQTLFRFTFRAPTRTVVVYTGCTSVGGGCVFTLDGAAYADLVPYARGTAPVTWDVAGVNGTTPGAVGVSMVNRLSFTEQDLVGGLYYWNSSGSVMRFDYGYPNAPPQTYLTRSDVGALTCVGCHVISRQGNLIVVGKDIPSPAAYSTLTVRTKQPAGNNLTGSANFFSFAPDERHWLQSNGVSIQWRDLTTGAVRNVTSGAMPDWSPSGTSMVFARPGSTPFFPVPGVASASLQTARFNGTGFDPPQVLVPFAGQNNYYPAWSPDGRYVLFNRSPSNKNSFDNSTPNDGGLPDGELWAVAASGGPPIRLVNASAPGAASWPKWAPVQHRYSGGNVMWLTFSSGRAYGLRLPEWQGTQLWMVAFDPARAALGQDPSFPAFWLPFQSLTSGNHIGQWSTQVPRGDCVGSGQSTCLVGEVCVAMRCRPG